MLSLLLSLSLLLAVVLRSDPKMILCHNPPSSRGQGVGLPPFLSGLSLDHSCSTPFPGSFHLIPWLNSWVRFASLLASLPPPLPQGLGVTSHHLPFPRAWG
jgi:hypothetical protein